MANWLLSVLLITALAGCCANTNSGSFLTAVLRRILGAGKTGEAPQLAQTVSPSAPEQGVAADTGSSDTPVEPTPVPAKEAPPEQEAALPAAESESGVAVAASSDHVASATAAGSRPQLAALAVFADSFDSAAAAAVLGKDIYSTQEQLSSLVDAGLLMCDQPAGRYRLANRRQDDEEAGPTESEQVTAEQLATYRRRHAAYYQELLVTVDDLFARANDDSAWAGVLLGTEWSNIRQGQQWATSNAEQDRAAARICADYATAGRRILATRQTPPERVAWLESGIAAARSISDRRAEAIALCALAGVQLDTGRDEQAAISYEQAAAAAAAVVDRETEAMALSNLGVLRSRLGRPAEAVQCLERALTADLEAGNRAGEAADLCNLGNAHFALKEYIAAAECYQGSLEVARSLSDRLAEARALWNLSLALEQRGELARALVDAEAAEAIFSTEQPSAVAAVHNKVVEWRSTLGVTSSAPTTVEVTDRQEA